MTANPTIGKLPRGRTVKIDVERILRSRMLVTAMSGAGKSWAIRRVLEQTHGAVQHLVIDPEGEFYTLREKFDYLLCGKGGDLPAEPRSAKLLARKLLEATVSAVIDISDLGLDGKRQFVSNFIDGLMNVPPKSRNPAFVIVDEAHKFAPESGKSMSREAVVDLMSAGRKRGLAGVLATQRLSKLSKDAAAEAGSLLIGRSTLDVDVKRACDALGFAAKADQKVIRSLEDGEFFYAGPAWKHDVLENVSPVMVGPVRTTHPKAGKLAPPVPPTPGAIAKIVASLEDLPEAAAEEARDLEQARERIRTLENEMRRAAVGKPSEADIESLRTSIDLSYGQGHSEGYMEGVRVIETMMRAEIDEIRERIREVDVDLGKIGDGDAAVMTAPRMKTESVGVSRPDLGEAQANRRANREKAGRAKSPTLSTGKHVSNPSESASGVGERGTLTGSQLRVLDAMAWLEAMRVPHPWPRRQVAFVARYSAKSGGFRNLLSQLKGMGLVTYPGEGTLHMTGAGSDIARYPDVATGAQLRDRALELCDGSMAKALRVLIAAGKGNARFRNEIAEECDWSPTSGGFRNTLSRLKTAGMVVYPSEGLVQADDVLFPDVP